MFKFKSLPDEANFVFNINSFEYTLIFSCPEVQYLTCPPPVSVRLCTQNSLSHDPL